MTTEVEYQHFAHGSYPDAPVKLWDGIELRSGGDGKFDELVTPGTPCIVHAEMMSSGQLFLSLTPVGQDAANEDRIVLWIDAVRGKLQIVTSVGD